jgi:methionyl-tRNA formyltransferase
MKILFLGYPNSPLIDFLQKQEDEVLFTKDKINASFILDNKIDFVVSYGYGHLIKEDVLRILPNKVINLHISYLPWNKGADPNFWSVIQDTPKGVTIHLVDKGLDTGHILFQELIVISDKETLRTSYEKLQKEIQHLFKKNWINIKTQRVTPKKQNGKGSYHKSKDKGIYVNEIGDKWLDIPICDLIDYVGEIQMSQQFWEKYQKEIEEIQNNTQ